MSEPSASSGQEKHAVAAGELRRVLRRRQGRRGPERRRHYLGDGPLGFDSPQLKDAMVEAYVLMQTEQGKMAEVVDRLSHLPGVVNAEVVTGPYDVVARISADDLDAIGRLIVSQVQTVGGVIRTLTCPVVRL